MNNLTLIDTDILIDVGRNDQKVINHLKKVSRKTILAISSITQMELIVGCRNKRELRALKKFLKRFEVILVNENIAERAIQLLDQYRLSHGLLIADSFIAATALEMGIQFSSKNQKDYRFIEGLQLLSYP